MREHGCAGSTVVLSDGQWLRWVAVAGVAALLLAWQPSAWAQAVPEGPQGLTAFEMVARIFHTVQAGLARFASGDALRPYGVKIALALGTVVVIWSVIKSWLLGKGFGQFFADVFPATIMLGLALVAMSERFSQAVIGTVNTVAAVVTQGAAGDGATMMMSMAAVAFSVFDMTPEGSVGFAEIPLYLVGLLVKLVAAIVLLMCAAIVGGVFLLAEVMIAIATGLAPVLVAWAVWKPTEFLFDGWLRFLLTAGMQKLMVALMVSLLGAVIGEMSLLAPQLQGGAADFIAYAGLLLVSVISAYLLWQAPQLAQALLTGRGGMGLSGWSAAATKGGNTAQRVTQGAVQQADMAAGATWQGVKHAWAAVRGNGAPGEQKSLTGHLGSAAGAVGSRVGAAVARKQSRNVKLPPSPPPKP